ncbi:MAG: hypothetical protein ABI611_18135 [Solirubrobacteraceae bacterium]
MGVGEVIRDVATHHMQESAPGTTGLPSVSVHLAAVRNGSVVYTVGVHAVCTRTPAGYQVVRQDVLVG